MTDDPLDKPVSVSLELTERGVNGAAHSRGVSGIDRLVGNLSDWFNPMLEGPIQRRRARNDIAVDAIRAEGRRQTAMIDAETRRLQLAHDQQDRLIERRQENKASVVAHALEDLREAPPSAQENAAGSERLDPDFLNRFERYAEDATSDQLRALWGRVLASEIRKPGQISRRVMRAVDELDGDTAAKFAQFVVNRIGSAVPKALNGELAFETSLAFVTAGLMVEPGMGGHMWKAGHLTESETVRYSWFDIGDHGLAITDPESLKPEASALLQSDEEARLSMPVFLLTDTGHAIASIIPNNTTAIADKLWEDFRDSFYTGVIKRYLRVGDKHQYLGQLATEGEAGED